MKFFKVFLLVTLNSFFCIQQAIAANSDLSTYITKLEAAANVCDNSMFSTTECTKTCTTSAVQLKEAKTLSGIKGDTKNAITNCMRAMAENDDGRNSPLFNQVGALQSRMTLELVTLKSKLLFNPPLASVESVVPAVIIESNIYDEKGVVDILKIPVLYDGLIQACQSQNSDSMKKMCANFCQSTKNNVSKLSNIVKQAPDEERNVYNLLITLEIDVNSSCANLFRKLPIAQQPKHYLSIVEFIGLIRSGTWPPKPSFDTDLPIIELTAEEKQKNEILAITGTKAVKDFTFSQAIKSIKLMPGYQAMEKSIRSISQDVETIHRSLNNYLSKESSYANQRQKWQAKVDELGVVGKRKELYESINAQCDISYLTKYRQPQNWHVKAVNTSTNMYGVANKAPFEQLLRPVHLHRLCYQQMTNEINSKYTNATTREELQAIAEGFISLAPTSGKAVARNSKPARVMSEHDWLPSWVAYKKSREVLFTKNDLIIKKEKEKEEERLRIERAAIDEKERLARIKKQKKDREAECQYKGTGVADDEFDAILFSLAKGCKKDGTVLEQVFMGGMSAYFIKACQIPKVSRARNSIKTFIASELLVTGMGYNFSAKDLSKTLGAQTQSQLAWVEGAEAAKKVGCGARADEIVSNISQYVNSTTRKNGWPSMFISGCVNHYNGRKGYDSKKCQCVASIARTLYPYIHYSEFDTQLFRDMTKANPGLAGQVMAQCKAFQF